jgi:hypothetical protein
MCVYFIGNHDTSRIKIGRSCDVEKRFATLAQANFYPVSLLAQTAGDEHVEGALHKRFAERRVRGVPGREFFHANEELLDLIQDIHREGYWWSYKDYAKELEADGYAPSDPRREDVIWHGAASSAQLSSVHIDPRYRGSVYKNGSLNTWCYKFLCGLGVWVEDDYRELVLRLVTHLSDDNSNKKDALKLRDTPVLSEMQITVDRDQVTCEKCLANWWGKVR